MKRRKKIPNFSQSEPEFLISYLDRHNDWAVIVCLVGGGQEIHTGEAGIAAWFQAGHWRYHAFRGDSWTTTRKLDRQGYLLNAYRVLLTRARQGVVIFVPPGDSADPTRAPEFYDQTFDYLTGLGVDRI